MFMLLRIRCPKRNWKRKTRPFKRAHINFPSGLEKDRGEGWTSEETKEFLPPKLSRIRSGTKL